MLKVLESSGHTDLAFTDSLVTSSTVPGPTQLPHKPERQWSDFSIIKGMKLIGDTIADFVNKDHLAHSHLSCSVHLLQLQPCSYCEQPEGVME